MISRKNVDFFLGRKTRENVVVLDFWAVDNFDLTRKIVKQNWGEKLVKCWGFVEIEFLDKNLNFRIVQKFLIFDIWDAHMLFEEQDDRKKLNSSLLRCKRQFFELPIGIWQLRRILELQLYFPFQKKENGCKYHLLE